MTNDDARSGSRSALKSPGTAKSDTANTWLFGVSSCAFVLGLTVSVWHALRSSPTTAAAAASRHSKILNALPSATNTINIKRPSLISTVDQTASTIRASPFGMPLINPSSTTSISSDTLKKNSKLISEDPSRLAHENPIVRPEWAMTDALKAFMISTLITSTLAIALYTGVRTRTGASGVQGIFEYFKVPESKDDEREEDVKAFRELQMALLVVVVDDNDSRK